MVYELEFIGNSDFGYVFTGELIVTGVAIREMYPDYSIYVPRVVAAFALQHRREFGVRMALIIAVWGDETTTNVGMMVQPVILKTRPIEAEQAPQSVKNSYRPIAL